MPLNLVVEDSVGQPYLKVQPSHPMIVKLVCKDHQDIFQQTKNASLSSSGQLAKLKEALQKAIVAELKKHEDQEDVALFEDGPQPSDKKDKKKHIKAKASQFFESVELEVNGSKVICLVPPNDKFQEVIVQMKEDMLEAVFNYLAMDCKETLENMVKRGYKRRKDTEG